MPPWLAVLAVVAHSVELALEANARMGVAVSRFVNVPVARAVAVVAAAARALRVAVKVVVAEITAGT